MRRCASAGARAWLSIALAVGALVAAPHDAVAQAGGSATLMPGSRVRITAPTVGRIVGTLVSTTRDSLHVALASGSSLALPRAALSSIELSAGVQRQGWRGAGLGLLVGAGVGGAIGLATYRKSECYDNPIEGFFCDIVNRTSRSVTVVSDAALVGTAGAVVGALIGQVGRERWIPVAPTRSDVRVGVKSWSAGGGAQIGISLTR